MELFYDAAVSRLGNVAQYNGNVSALQWQNAHFAEEQAYVYRYDGFNRLQAGHYRNFTRPEQQRAYDEMAIQYDANGNLVGLERYRWQDAGRTLIDGLTYTLAGNQLQRVQDSSGRPQGFSESGTPGDDYGYDANGGMVLDRNQGITVTYNHLNLPVRIADRSGAAIQYTYDAQGAKLAQTVLGVTTTVVTDYAGDFVYANGALRYIAHEAGILVPAAAGSEWVYHYYLPDHLGSVRVTFAVRRQGPGGRPTAAIVQAADYYPFGWQLGGNQFQARNAPPIDHLYNGKEFQDEIGLNWYDYGARMYDPALGRWHVVDAEADTYYSHSPYAYVLNNPVRHVDPEGRFCFTPITLVACVVGGLIAAETTVEEPRPSAAETVGRTTAGVIGAGLIVSAAPRVAAAGVERGLAGAAAGGGGSGVVAQAGTDLIRGEPSSPAQYVGAGGAGALLGFGIGVFAQAIGTLRKSATVVGIEASSSQGLSQIIAKPPLYRTFGEAFGKGEHVAEVIVRHNGRTIGTWWEASGAAGHTEMQALSRVNLQRGVEVEIRGWYPPCPWRGGCMNTMNALAKQTGASIIYRTPRAVYQFPVD
jgi:RHS repeat-associated protein